MNLPKTTELSLKTIVEGMEQISTKVGQAPKEGMTPEMKRQLKEMALMFNEYASAFEGAEKIKEAAHAIGEFMKLAEMYAINEGGDVFQENIIKQNFKEAAKKVVHLQKIAQECYARKQQMNVLFDDIRHIVERYYKVSNQNTNSNPPVK